MFGPGFEQRLKTRSETEETIGKAALVGKPFFVGQPPGESDTDLAGLTRAQFQDLSPIHSHREHNLQQGCWEPRPQLIPTISKSSIIPATASMNLTRPDFLPTGMFLEIFQQNIPQEVPQTARLKFFFPVWERITQDPWVLEVIQGYKIELVTPPVQQSLPLAPKLSSTQEAVLEQEINNLLIKQAIHPVYPAYQGVGFISSMFVVPKKDGGNRPVVNLKPLNQYLAYEHFKMEGIHLLRDLLKKGDFLVKIDLKDAYLTVPIWKNHQKY